MNPENNPADNMPKLPMEIYGHVLMQSAEIDEYQKQEALNLPAPVQLLYIIISAALHCSCQIRRKTILHNFCFAFSVIFMPHGFSS